MEKKAFFSNVLLLAILVSSFSIISLQSFWLGVGKTYLWSRILREDFKHVDGEEETQSRYGLKEFDLSGKKKIMLEIWDMVKDFGIHYE